jgi:hypothetical protein
MPCMSSGGTLMENPCSPKKTRCQIKSRRGCDSSPAPVMSGQSLRLDHSALRPAFSRLTRLLALSLTTTATSLALRHDESPSCVPAP